VWCVYVCVCVCVWWCGVCVCGVCGGYVCVVSVMCVVCGYGCGVGAGTPNSHPRSYLTSTQLTEPLVQTTTTTPLSLSHQQSLNPEESHSLKIKDV